MPEDQYPDSDDPREWAKAFCDHFWLCQRSPNFGYTINIGDQVGTMERWFATAIKQAKTTQDT